MMNANLHANHFFNALFLISTLNPAFIWSLNEQTTTDPPPFIPTEELKSLPDTGIGGRFFHDRRPPYTIGDRAHLFCERGYTEPNESISVVAVEDDRYVWKPSRIDCIPLPALMSLPKHGAGGFIDNHKGSPFLPGDYVYLKCNRGYTPPVRTSFRVVEKNGQLFWDPAERNCIPVQCPHPDIPAHASVSNTHFEHPNSFKFSCDEGYRSNSPDFEYKCSTLGKWIPCIDKHFRCEPVETVMDGTTNLTDSPPSQPDMSSSEPLPIEMVVDETQSNTTLPDSPLVPGLMSLPKLGAGGFFDTHKKPPFLRGDFVLLKCKKGYTPPFRTIFHVVEKDDQLFWEPAERSCIPVQCPPPEIPIRASVSNTHFEYPNSFKFSCDEGYKSNKPDIEYKCSAYGQWTPCIDEHFRCEPVKTVVDDYTTVPDSLPDQPDDFGSEHLLIETIVNETQSKISLPDHPSPDQSNVTSSESIAIETVADVNTTVPDSSPDQPDDSGFEHLPIETIVDEIQSKIILPDSSPDQSNVTVSETLAIETDVGGITILPNSPPKILSVSESPVDYTTTEKNRIEESWYQWLRRYG